MAGIGIRLNKIFNKNSIAAKLLGFVVVVVFCEVLGFVVVCVAFGCSGVTSFTGVFGCSFVTSGAFSTFVVDCFGAVCDAGAFSSV